MNTCRQQCTWKSSMVESYDGANPQTLHCPTLRQCGALHCPNGGVDDGLHFHYHDAKKIAGAGT
jgi:hypothetical protein